MNGRLLPMLVGLAMSAGFMGTRTVYGQKRTGWIRPRNTLWHDKPGAVEAAQKKREMRAEKVRKAVIAGGYGLTPFVGTPGYVPNNHHERAARGLPLINPLAVAQ